MNCRAELAGDRGLDNTSLTSVTRNASPGGVERHVELPHDRYRDATPGRRRDVPRAGTAFRLIANADRRAVFANPEHDYPQRILYWIDEDGALHARIEGTQNGENRASEWRWEPM